MVKPNPASSTQNTVSIYPSLLAADALNLEKTILELDEQYAGFHIDLMDGHFVPNIAFGPDLINAIDRISRKPVWVHLMAENPLQWIKKLTVKEKSIVSFHIESHIDIKQVVSALTEKNLIPSIAINPKTPVNTLSSIIDQNIGQVLLMTVEPGFYGQKFIPEVLTKIPFLTDLRQKRDVTFSLAVDGGVTWDRLPELAEVGITQTAMGSGVFHSK